MLCHTNLHDDNTTIGQSGFVPQPGLKKDKGDGAVKSHRAVIQQKLLHCNTLKPTTNRYRDIAHKDSSTAIKELKLKHAAQPNILS